MTLAFSESPHAVGREIGPKVGKDDSCDDAATGFYAGWLPIVGRTRRTAMNNQQEEEVDAVGVAVNAT